MSLGAEVDALVLAGMKKPGRPGFRVTPSLVIKSLDV